MTSKITTHPADRGNVDGPGHDESTPLTYSSPTQTPGHPLKMRTSGAVNFSRELEDISRRLTMTKPRQEESTLHGRLPPDKPVSSPSSLPSNKKDKDELRRISERVYVGTNGEYGKPSSSMMNATKLQRRNPVGIDSEDGKSTMRNSGVVTKNSLLVTPFSKALAFQRILEDKKYDDLEKKQLFNDLSIDDIPMSRSEIFSLNSLDDEARKAESNNSIKNIAIENKKNDAPPSRIGVEIKSESCEPAFMRKLKKVSIALLNDSDGKLASIRVAGMYEGERIRHDFDANKNNIQVIGHYLKKGIIEFRKKNPELSRDDGQIKAYKTTLGKLRQMYYDPDAELPRHGIIES